MVNRKGHAEEPERLSWLVAAMTSPDCQSGEAWQWMMKT